MSVPELLPLGPDGVLVRFSDELSEPANRAALAFRAVVERDLPEGVVETATALTSVFFRFRPDLLRRADLEERLRYMLVGEDWLAAALPEGRRLWRVPASFGGRFGPDLEECAAAASMQADAAIDEICNTRLRVLALGFAPGQPYLGFLPEHWNIPRRNDVTPEVPRGAVVVAVRQVIPFASAAPTGWRQIGRTAFRCHDPGAKVPLPLRAGDEMQFEPVSAADLERYLKDASSNGGAVAELLS